jgi:hypothetical protein
MLSSLWSLLPLQIVIALAAAFGFERIPAPLAFALPPHVGMLPYIAQAVAV